jgi:hypothetical protein
MRSRVGKISLLLFLFASIGLKIEFLSTFPDRVKIGEAELVRFLKRHSFEVSSPNPNIDPPVFFANAENCSIKVYLVSPNGWHRDLIHQLNPTDQLFFVYRGDRFPEQPVWTTWLELQWWRFNTLIGRTLPIHSVLAVVSTQDCAETVPWREVT